MLHALTENILHRSYLQETENVDYSEIQHGIMLLIQAIAYSLSSKKMMIITIIIVIMRINNRHGGKTPACKIQQ